MVTINDLIPITRIEVIGVDFGIRLTATVTVTMVVTVSRRPGPRRAGPGPADSLSNQLDNRRHLVKKLGLAAVLVALATLITTTPVIGQTAKKKQSQRISPHETITKTVDGSELKLVYQGVPTRRNRGPPRSRKIWGRLVPYPARSQQLSRRRSDPPPARPDQPVEIGGYSLAVPGRTRYSYAQ